MIVTAFILLAVLGLSVQAAREGYRSKSIISAAAVVTFTWVAIWHLKTWMALAIWAFT
jgi:hypothetical protein